MNFIKKYIGGIQNERTEGCKERFKGMQ
ncbi:hypothetical protein BSG1_12366 [Bacillus sp. SG-1]|nr:hypothetical protein BSG1_12366 [Bacillus sp. SG-1]